MIHTFLGHDKTCLSLIGKYSSLMSRIELELMLSKMLCCKRESLYVDNKALSPDESAMFENMIEQRSRKIPLQYIINSEVFMDKEFFVNEKVFIPRPETELLVKETLQAAVDRPQLINILDLCTGSGNVAISIACALDNINVYASDISEKALEIARYNAKRHKVEDRITFYNSDIFNTFPIDKKHSFDIIVCNPPYIKREDIAYLQEEVRFEPMIALDGGSDGLDFYRRLSKESPMVLKNGGSLILEIGIGQLGAIRNIFGPEQFCINDIQVDHQGIERVVWINLS